jgi:hypothetical protein
MYLVIAKLFRMWWPGTELNRRRQPFQGWNRPALSYSKHYTNLLRLSRKRPFIGTVMGQDFGRSKFALPLLFDCSILSHFVGFLNIGRRVCEHARLHQAGLTELTCVRCGSASTASSPPALAVPSSCFRLTVASNRPCRGLAPPIDHPCPTHSPSLRSGSLRPTEGKNAGEEAETLLLFTFCGLSRPAL